MTNWKKFLKNLSAGPLFEGPHNFVGIELNNSFPLTPPEDFHAYIFDHLGEGEIGFGGYLEHRKVYGQSPVFIANGRARSIHLGTDFWTDAGVAILAPIDGVVVGFKNNAGKGNYGGTLILRHQSSAHCFYTLYGHLGLSMQLEQGHAVCAGEQIAVLGDYPENGNWPPHLHFQILTEYDEADIDYPGVCFPEEVEKFSDLCPDPNWLLAYE